MTSYIPVTLVGFNLGQRHHYFNSLVNEAYKRDVSFESLQNLPEKSPIDRLFKIDLAAKFKNLKYIISNLKDEDMLYVSRALKCSWILDPEYSNIINPDYLENVLFPEMTTTAVKKVQHWIQLNLKDTHRSEEFYKYYIGKGDSGTAFKFLLHCCGEFVLNTVKTENIFEKLSLKYLKILCEKCPKVAEVYFETLESNETVLLNYLKKEEKYYNNLSFLLKVNPDLFLNITEKYFNNKKFKSFSPEATKYIMVHKKDRFTSKPELYSAWLLDMKTLGKCLSSAEIKDVILRLARAKYLGSGFFSYKKVEPFIKCLDVEERTSFKRQIFVDKIIGDTVKDWPYTPPSAPSKKISDINIFADNISQNYTNCRAQRELCCRCCCSNAMLERSFKKRCIKQKTLLDKLFDQYRFASFEHTLLELQKRILSESSSQNRQYMLLVLVSKSGGRPESVGALLRLLLMHHSNEPATLRAAIVRSLVRRTAAWRLPSDLWCLLLQFAQGLGLDGAPADAFCCEGLHAVVLRHLLNDDDLVAPVRNAFLCNFSSLTEYPLDVSERCCVQNSLRTLLLSVAASEPSTAPERLSQLLNTLKAYSLRVDQCPGVLAAIATAARLNPDAARPLLRRLFDARVARREFFRENFDFIQNDDSYLNALRHDAELLITTDHFQNLVARHELRHERSVRTLAIYFSEESGVASKCLAVLERALFETTLNIRLARPTARLAGATLLLMLQKLDTYPTGSTHRRLAAALRGCGHLARPPLDLNAVGWSAAGLKAVANRITVCSATSADRHLLNLLSLRRGARLATAMALRQGLSMPFWTVLQEVGTLRPTAAVRAALRYFRLCKETSDIRVWTTVRPFMFLCFDTKTKSPKQLHKLLSKTYSLPSSIKIDYCVVVYKILMKSSLNIHYRMLNPLESLLPEVDEEFVANIIENFISKELVPGISYFSGNTEFFVTLLAKFLLLCKSETVQRERFNNLCKPFFDKIETLLKSSSNKIICYHLLNYFFNGLKYNTVFFSSEYVSCLSVFEWITAWMRKALPVEQNIDRYVHILMTLIYYKSVKQSIKQKPEVFAEEKRKMNEGVEIVGTVFGKYLSQEVDELLNRYFISIMHLYKKDMLAYLRSEFYYGDSRERFVTSIIKGFLEVNRNKNSLLFAEYVYYRDIRHYSCSSANDVLNILKNINSKEIQFFLGADVYSNILY